MSIGKECHAGLGRSVPAGCKESMEKSAMLALEGVCQQGAMRGLEGSVRGDMYILGSEVGTKIKIPSETRDFNFCSHLRTEYIYII